MLKALTDWFILSQLESEENVETRGSFLSVEFSKVIPSMEAFSETTTCN